MKRILIVDDSPIIHNLLKTALEKNGYEVCGSAKNGKDGFEQYGKLRPDVVFMDITMPVMDGLEAARAIKGAYKDAKIIMLSAMGDDEVLAEANEIGVDIFLKKPFNEYKVISALSKMCE